MIICTSGNYQSQTPTVVALGCFDGVHRGHAAVISEARRRADELHVACTVWTFAAPPKNYFVPGSTPLLSDPAEKQITVEKLGADLFLCVPFDERIASLSPADFIGTLICKQLRARHLVCGFNFTFGAGGAGNTDTLRNLCREHGVGLTVVEPVMEGGEPVSSSRIRALITEGDVALAEKLLGRPYSLLAPVVQGQHLARRLGFPTANQLFPAGYAVPRYGVYVSRAEWNGKAAYGITNIGIRPTVEGHQLCAETHIFDEQADLYGKEVRTSLLHFIRPETRFPSVEKLSRQVHSDIQTARDYVKENR